MSRLPVLVLAGALGAAVVVGPVAPRAEAAPTCPTPATQPACGFRVVPEAVLTASFLQFEQEFVPALEAIEAIAPEIVEVTTLGELIGQPELRSAGDRQIWVARVTDESVAPEGKKQVLASLSVHGTEPAGREGGIRYLEDLARWWAAGEQDRTLYSGPHELSLGEALAGAELYLAWLNPDGWAAGDLATDLPVFARGNATGSDLNREFPTTGWTKLENTQLSEPEAVGWTTFVDSLPNLVTATDIHGELTSNTGSFADMMWPAGEWTPKEQAQELALARHMVQTIERKFAEGNVAWTMITEPAAGDQGATIGVATKPAEFATAYDIVGYDDSGFMGDFFVSRGAIEIDVEAFLSHLVPGTAWLAPLEQGHVAGVRGILETVLVEAFFTQEAELDLDLGNVAYVDDPATVSSTDEDDFGNYAEAFDGSEPLEYDVTRLQYFRDLGDYVGRELPALAAADVASGAVDLTAFDSVVVSDVAYPADPRGRTYDEAAYRDALLAFAEQGGQLVLLDGAVPMLADLGLVDEGDLVEETSQAGHVDFGERDHPWEADLEGLAQQTYYAVPLGYRSGSSIREAPHHGVVGDAWQAAGGTTVGTTVESGMTNLGELPVGDGRVAIYGAILPTQTEENPHVYGLANYAVTVNGGSVLHNMLEHRAPNATAPGAPEQPAPAPAPAPTVPTPVTGGGLAVVAFALAGAAARRRG